MNKPSLSTFKQVANKVALIWTDIAGSLQLHIELLLNVAQYKRRVSHYVFHCFLAVAEMTPSGGPLDLRFSVGPEC